MRIKSAMQIAAWLLVAATCVTSKAVTFDNENTSKSIQFPPADINSKARDSYAQGTDVAEKRIDPHHDKLDGYWKKKLIWKQDWVTIWVPAYKKIWKTEWRKYYKPVWVPTQKSVWKTYSYADWKKVWRPIWVPTQIPAWKEIQVPEFKRIWKPVWVETKVAAWKDIQVPDWKKIWVPEWIKVKVPGSKTLEKGHDYEIIAHDLWKKKLIWKPVWKKYWKTVKKQIWVPSKKLEWKEDWKKVWKTVKKQIWVPSKKLEWKEEWKQIWKTGKKLVWIPDKKLEWKEAWKTVQVPAWKKIWKKGWKKVWKPVWISEWIIVQHDHHHPEPEHHHPEPEHHGDEHGWERRDAGQSSASGIPAFRPLPPGPYAIEGQKPPSELEDAPRWGRSPVSQLSPAKTGPSSSIWNFPKQ